MTYQKKFLVTFIFFSTLIAILPNLALATGCGGLDQTIRKYHYEAQVTVKDSEDCSIGHYQLTIKTPNGSVFRFNDERDGVIKQMWVEPLNGSGSKQPSIILLLRSVGSGNYADIKVYMPDKNNRYVLKSIARLPSDVKGYEGDDDYFVAGGIIYRSFPCYKPKGSRAMRVKDTASCPNGGVDSFKYDFKRNQWIREWWARF